MARDIRAILFEKNFTCVFKEPSGRAKMRFYIVDAFTETLFGGNPAGVVLLSPGTDFPLKEVMLRTAAELRYSETVFVQKNEDGSYHLRYFTPTDEVDLCGHATIGAFSAMWKTGMLEGGVSYNCETAAGKIKVSVGKGTVMMGMATPADRGRIDEAAALEELYTIMGLVPSDGEVRIPGGERLFPEIISTGLPDILLPVADKKVLERCRPDMLALGALSERYGVTGVHAFAFGDGATAYCRNFAPAFGIPEEAATGTSNGALTYYLYKNGMIEAGQECLYIQGESMGRPSKIVGELRIEEESGETPERIKIRIGGNARILAEGEIYI